MTCWVWLTSGCVALRDVVVNVPGGHGCQLLAVAGESEYGYRNFRFVVQNCNENPHMCALLVGILN